MCANKVFKLYLNISRNVKSLSAYQHGKNSFVEISKNLVKYRSENNFIELSK